MYTGYPDSKDLYEYSNAKASMNLIGSQRNMVAENIKIAPLM